MQNKEFFCIFLLWKWQTRDVQYDSDNIAIVIGNESNGVRKEILDRCTDYVKIPMAEGQSSLNIAVAAALLLYEYDRVLYHS